VLSKRRDSTGGLDLRVEAAAITLDLISM
jgi:hypothetical protein